MKPATISARPRTTSRELPARRARSSAGEIRNDDVGWRGRRLGQVAHVRLHDRVDAIAVDVLARVLDGIGIDVNR